MLVSKENNILFLQIVSIVSIAGSIAVILTFVAFKSSRKKLFVRIITFISVSDLFGNIFYITSYRPPNGSFLCTLSGVFNQYFYPASWLWSTVLAYFLYSLAAYGRLPMSELVINLICWGLPLLLTIPIFSFATFGKDDDANSFEVCIFADNGGVVLKYYHTFSYYGLWFLCIILMIFWYCKMWWFSDHFDDAWKPNYNMALKAIRLYPLAMFLCWLPHCVVVTLREFYLNTSNLSLLHSMADAFKILNGGVVACIFFWKSHEARFRWKQLFSSYYSFAFRARTSFSSSDVTHSMPERQSNEVLVEDFSLAYNIGTVRESLIEM